MSKLIRKTVNLDLDTVHSRLKSVQFFYFEGSKK